MLLLEVISNEQLVKPDRGRMRFEYKQVEFELKSFFYFSLDFIELQM